MEASKKRGRDGNNKRRVLKRKLPEGGAEGSPLERPEEKDQWEPPPCLKHHNVRRIFP